MAQSISPEPLPQDFAQVEVIVAPGSYSKKAKIAAEQAAATIQSSRIAFRLYRAAAMNGHHKIGQIFLERRQELLTLGN